VIPGWSYPRGRPALPQRPWTRIKDFMEPKSLLDAGVTLSDFADRNYFHKEGKILPP